MNTFARVLLLLCVFLYVCDLLKAREFAPPSSVYAFGHPVSVATADFNHDGKVDFAVANAATSYISVLFGNGDGTFAAEGNYLVGFDPAFILAADFNHDGNKDLAVSNHFDGTVTVLLGKPDGTFVQSATSKVGTGPATLAAADLNLDNSIDLVAANNGAFIDTPGNSISVLLGRGDGTFEPAMTTDSGLGTLGLVARDFNHDGKWDVAVTNAEVLIGGPHTIGILMGQGDGTFRAPVKYPTSSSPNSITAGDFNHDGELDLATANTPDSTVSVFRGIGDGTFKPAITYVVGLGPKLVITGDISKDGNFDLLTVNHSTVTVLLGTGTGSFFPGVEYSVGELGSLPIGGAIADFDQNGFPDIAVANQFGGSSDFGFVNIILNTGGDGPAVSLAPGELTYGSQLLGTTVTRKVFVSSVGKAPLLISGIFAGTTNFSESASCPSTLAPGASCAIDVSFHPPSTGPKRGTLTVATNAPDSPETNTLKGSGTRLKILPTPLDFGTVHVGAISMPLQATLTNTGTTTLTIKAIYIQGANFREFHQTHTCASTVSPNASCTISVVLQPRDSGRVHAILYIRNSGGGDPDKLPLIGLGN